MKKRTATTKMENLEFFSQNYPGGFFSYKADKGEEFVFVSEFLLNMLGYTEEEFRIATGNTFTGLIYPPDRKEALSKIHQEAPVSRRNAFDSCSYRAKKKDGSLIWLHDEGHLVTLPTGLKIYFVVVVDITDYKQVLTAQSELISCIKALSSSQGFEDQMQTVLDSVFAYYEGSRCVIHSVYDNGKKMRNSYERCAKGVSSLKAGLQNVNTKDFGPFISSLEKHDYVVIDQKEIGLDPDRKHEYDLLKRNSIHLFIAVPIKMNGQLVGFIGVANPKQNVSNHEFLQNIGFFVYDAIQKHELHDRLVSLSLKDELTGLPNRYCYDQTLDAMKGKTNKDVGVIFADLNGLKYINDHFGHRYGDIYLKNFAISLCDAFEEKNVYRISGDEFVVIIKDISDQDFDKMQKDLLDDVTNKGFEVASFGAIHCPRCSEPLHLITEAEALMYEKKKVFHESRPVLSDEEREKYYRKRFAFLPK